MGICLSYVQLAEETLQFAVESVLDDPELRLSEQSEPERKATLADFLKKLRRRVKLEPDFRESLYRFREMRNIFIHNLSEIPGWNILTADGRDIATKFLFELIFRSYAIAGVFMTLPAVSAKVDFNKDLFADADANERTLGEMLEKKFGSKARA